MSAARDDRPVATRLDADGAGDCAVSHVVASLDRATAGPSYSVTALANAQARLGADVAVLSVGDPDPSGHVFDDLRYRADFCGWPVLGRMMLSSDLWRGLVSRHAHIIHDHGLWLMPNIYAARAAGMLGAKFVLAPRGMLSPVALRFSRSRKAIFSLLFQRKALERVDMFHATSEAEAEEIRALGFTQPIAVVPNGIALPDPVLLDAAPKDGRTVITLGRIHPKKGIDRLIRAWSKVAPLRPDWRLVIVGPDEAGHVAELRSLIHELRLTTVEIHDALLGEAKIKRLASSEVFVLPTLGENFAMTVAESLASGTPVISTKGAPWAGLVENKCGWWVDHGVEPLAEALLAALDLAPQVRAQMGRNGREWMSAAFREEAVAGQMLAAYRWLISGGERPAWVWPAIEGNSGPSSRKNLGGARDGVGGQAR
ncbi:glycosyltransferase [Limibaculum sp. M0105]|uniref:Glycosyltransferase n=1 Tax=Thermohalobaculum xanthum TaxID=2753746 RepID=A0A8J7M3Y6_9RHOB|nr:glycosyltransferase [Thermohalobaculum xanthum]MBK0397901.1 glycosyltransferase [Thermohalobaculum xanthum]